MNKVGMGTRTLNFLVDTFIIFWLSFLFSKIYSWYVYYYAIKPYNFGWFFFSTMFIYYFLLESFFSRTVGKWVTHTIVVDTKGMKPTVTLILIRSLIRLTLIDMFFIPFLDKTLHDYVSKTEVVEV
jgi:uncharacterized RDD family membrane protein YckC